MTDVANVLDLPNSKNLDRTLSRHQPEIGAAIIKISEREMRIAMAEEIRYTIIAEKGEEYYKQWENLPLEERDTVGLVILYDMGWQRRSSGHAYNSMSGHAFAIGQHTGLIIDCVVYSTACKQCEMNNQTETTIGGDETFWQLSNTNKDYPEITYLDQST